jgi:hypothetical protein
MNINKFNSEGYIDSTAYKALTRIEQETKKTVFKPMVFICSPFAGEVESNICRAQGYCRFAVKKNVIPFAPHLLFPQFLDDDDKVQRALGLSFGMVFLCKCYEIWVFGHKITNGMALEIEKAKQRNISIRYFNDKCEEVESI